MQKMLSVVGTASIFLPWMQINLFITTASLNLLDLTLGGVRGAHPLTLLAGILFIAGTLGLLVWKKAPLLQIAGLILFPLGILSDVMSVGGGLDEYLAAFDLLQTFTGIGVYVGWGATLCGMVLMLKGWPTPRLVQDVFGRLHRTPQVRKAAAPVTRIPTVPVMLAQPTSAPQISFPTAIENAERHLASGDVGGALTWYGRALGTSRDDEERAISKVRIASVLRSLGKDQEARLFIDEAQKIDPEDVSGWSIYLEDRSGRPAAQAWGALI